MAAVLQDGQNEPCPLGLMRTDGAEDVSRAGALIMRRRGARSALCPPPGDLVLLTDPLLHPGTTPLSERPRPSGTRSLPREGELYGMARPSPSVELCSAFHRR